MTRTHRPGFAFLGLLLLLGACGTTQYYLLPLRSQPAVQYASAYRSISVGDISLPAYAEAIEIPALQDDGAVVLQRNRSWADDPGRGLTRYLAGALELRLGARVATDPWPSYSEEPQIRIEVTVDRLIGAPRGIVELEGQYFILRPESGAIVATERFRFQMPVQGKEMTDLVAAHARAMDALADQIAARLAGRATS